MRHPSRLLLLAAALAASGGAQAAQANVVDSHARDRTEGRQRQARVQVGVPLVKQAYRNNCETASLSMLLAAAGVTVDQRQLQRELVKSGAPDPSLAADGSWTWGDPALGFVGRVMGGGTAGGFGVYEGPIRQLASSYGVTLADLSRQPIELVLSRLRAGRPVMAWIGLSEGPYKRWRSPSGKLITVNFGEHVVVLTGMRGAMINVNDPLTGTRLQWTVAQFTEMWWRLGKRALSL